MEPKEIIEAHIAGNRETIIAKLEGRNGGLRPSKPSDGFSVYVWRMCRFFSGIDPTMPITCYWELEHWVEERTGRPFRSYQADSKEAMRVLDAFVTEVQIHYKLGNAGAMRWAGLLGV